MGWGSDFGPVEVRRSQENTQTAPSRPRVHKTKASQPVEQVDKKRQKVIDVSFKDVQGAYVAIDKGGDGAKSASLLLVFPSPRHELRDVLEFCKLKTGNVTVDTKTKVEGTERESCGLKYGKIAVHHTEEVQRIRSRWGADHENPANATHGWRTQQPAALAQRLQLKIQSLTKEIDKAAQAIDDKQKEGLAIGKQLESNEASLDDRLWDDENEDAKNDKYVAVLKSKILQGKKSLNVYRKQLEVMIQANENSLLVNERDIYNYVLEVLLVGVRLWKNRKE